MHMGAVNDGVVEGDVAIVNFRVVIDERVYNGIGDGGTKMR
jgi:hypothetical protein